MQAKQYQSQLIIGTKTLKSKVQDNVLLVSWQENEGASSAFGSFSADVINDISSGFVDTPQELFSVIESCKTSGLLSISQQGNVLIKFNLDVGGKIKTKNINLILKQKQLGDIEGLKIENEKLKVKTKLLQKQVSDLKLGFSNLQAQLSYMSSTLSRIQNKWPLVDKFFINDRNYQLNQHWQLQAYTNVVEFVRKNGNNNVRVSGITVMQNQTKDKRFVLQ